jgi:hypothetical protein
MKIFDGDARARRYDKKDGHMNAETSRRMHRVTALITFASLVFYLFFQVNKSGPFRNINPFGQDPYDAVGSLAIQGALLVGLLTYARVLRLREDPTQAIKARLILRGNILVLLAILATLMADVIAEIVSPFPPSYWGTVLLAELGVMLLLALLCVVALIVAFRHTPTVAPPSGLTPAEGIDDLWALVRIPVTKFNAVLPWALVEWVKHFHSDRLFAHVRWLNPHSHPWRFASALGLLVGVGLTVMHLQEGLPPNLKIGLLVAGIFVSAELSATLLGFALLGGYLGLRPAFNLGK